MMPRLLLMILLLAPLAGHAAPTLLILGDSLSAAYGLDQNEGWVSLLEQRLAREGHPVRVVNASISGDTTGGALARLPAELERHRPSVVLIELGGNDGLRGLPLEQMRRNLADIITACRARGARVALAGMRLPPNYGRTYTQGFERIYPALAHEYDVTLIPFLLEGLDDGLEHFQSDAIHPDREAQSIILDTVWKYLRPLLD